jgi:hypothetical protein
MEEVKKCARNQRGRRISDGVDDVDYRGTEKVRRRRFLDIRKASSGTKGGKGIGR